jgi:hypothetical protein
MATTTNYGWTTPNDTDLVKDGAAAIRTLGSSVDTTTKALNPSTTLGDIEYRSSTANTNTRLGIGSTGQVLTVAGGVPSWATPTASNPSYSLLNAGGTALTGSTTVTVSGISGKNDLFIIVSAGSSANASAEFSLRFNTDTGANYFQRLGVAYAASTASQDDITYDSGNTTSLLISRMSGNAGSAANAYATVTGTDTAGLKMVTSGSASNGAGANFAAMLISGGYWSGSGTVTSVSLVSSTGNFDAGTIYVYGA